MMHVCLYFSDSVSIGVTANSVHPGVVVTEVMRHYSFWVRYLFNILGVFFFKVSVLYFTTVTVTRVINASIVDEQSVSVKTAPKQSDLKL